MLDRQQIEQGVKEAVAAAAGNGQAVALEQSLVADLGFNSLKVASLSIALEDQFERTLLLNDWIVACTDPLALTVGSLCDFVEQALASDG